MSKPKYLLFAYYRYYPSGGLKDLRGKFESMEELMSHLSKNYSDFSYYDYYEILNTETLTISDFDFSLVEDRELEEDEDENLINME